MNPVASAAADYAARGFPVLPLRANSKVPATPHGKNDASTDPAQVAAWFPADTSLNVGVLTGERAGLVVLDIDPRNDGEAGLERLERTYGKLPRTLRAKTGGGGFHFYYSVPLGTERLADRPGVAGFRGVDIKAHGYVVAAPSVHESGKAYEWDGNAPIAPAPDWLVGLARGEKRIKSAPMHGNATVPEGGRNDMLFRTASGLRARGLSPEAILAAVTVENAARCIPPLDHAEVERIVQSAMRYEPNSQYPETELGNARRLVELMNGDARYEPASRTWFVWNDRRWARDEEGYVIRLAKRVVDDLLSVAKLVNDPDTFKRRVAFAHKSQSAARIAGMVELAKTEPGVPIQFDAFDLESHSLNVANGMIDLRTGVLRPHSREAFATQMIDVEYDPAAHLGLDRSGCGKLVRRGLGYSCRRAAR